MKIIIRIIIVVMLIVGACVSYAFFIEPNLLIVKNHSLGKEGTEELKIVQFSDTHIGKDYTIKELSKLVDKINKQNPDVIVFTGDFFNNYSQTHQEEEVTKELLKLSASYAKLAVWGNRDYGGGAQRVYPQIMEESGFVLLENETYSMEVNGKTITFGGVDDYLLGAPELVKTSEAMVGDYRILIMHEPDGIDEIKESSIDLVLSGHSHGGQVKLPFFKGVTTEYADKYIKGFYTINEKMKLYVSPGIGTTRIPARFMVPPEISVFDIKI